MFEPVCRNSGSSEVSEKEEHTVEVFCLSKCWRLFFLIFSESEINTDRSPFTPPPQPALAILLLVEKNNHTKF